MKVHCIIIDNSGKPEVKILVHGVECALERHDRVELLRLQLHQNTNLTDKVHFEIQPENTITKFHHKDTYY